MKKTEPETPQAPKLARLPVPTEDFPAGTLLNAENLKKFKFIEFTPPAPAEMVGDINDYAGKYLTKDISAGQFVPLKSVGEKPLVIAAEPLGQRKEGTGNSSAGKDPLKDLETQKAKPIYWDTTVQTSGGLKKYRYQKLASGEYKFIGELKDEGSTDEDKQAPEPAPKSVPSEGKSPNDKPI